MTTNSVNQFYNIISEIRKVKVNPEETMLGPGVQMKREPPGTLAHIYNPSCPGSRDQEDLRSRAAQLKS
jgi:hypothetical protein